MFNLRNLFKKKYKQRVKTILKTRYGEVPLSYKSKRALKEYYEMQIENLKKKAEVKAAELDLELSDILGEDEEQEDDSTDKLVLGALGSLLNVRKGNNGIKSDTNGVQTEVNSYREETELDNGSSKTK